MDMEKRLILAVALSILIYAAFVWLSPPPQTPPEPPPAEPAAQGEPQRGADAEAAPPPAEQPETDEAAQAVAAAEEQEIAVDNGVFDVRLTNRGGRALTWTLQHFTTPKGAPLQVLPRFVDNDRLPLAIELDDENLASLLNGALYAVEREPVESVGDWPSGERVTFVWSDGRGLEARKSFVFRRGEYLVDLEIEVLDRGRALPVRLAVGPGFAAQESSDGQSNYYYDGQAVWNVGGSVTRKKGHKLGDDGGFSGAVRWVGLEDQYFAALILPSQARATVQYANVELVPRPFGTTAADEAPEAGLEPIISATVPPEGARLFVGPKKYTLLRDLGQDLDKVVWFSSMDWLRPIVKYLFLGLIWIHDRVQNWGLAIVLATLILRLVLFPVNQYSMVSMKRSQLQMQRLQPKVKAIRNRYKKSKDAQTRAKMNQEMMELYRKEGVNPMGGVSGCLPLLAQFPILIGFYNMLTVAVELRGAPFFGWIQDLSREDPYWITPILMAVTMFAQQKLAMSKIKDPQQLQQQRFMLFMPIMFGFICLQMPSGLVLYWFMNNLLGMGQQWLVNRHTGRLEAAAQKA